MTIKVSLQVEGIDLLSDAILDAIADSPLAELGWSGLGEMQLATCYSVSNSPVSEAVEHARLIRKCLDGHVRRAFDELVSTAEIASRCEVTAEAVRLWTSGQRRSQGSPFPVPRQIVSTGTGRGMRIYAWREVVGWVRLVLGIDPDEGIEYLSDLQLADLNYDLATHEEEDSGRSTVYMSAAAQVLATSIRSPQLSEPVRSSDQVASA